MSQLLNALPVPELRPLLEDTINMQNQIPVIRFQFIPNNFQEGGGANWSSATGMNRENPITQFSNGEQKTISFEARLWATDNNADISEMVDALKLAVARDPKLKRPPRFNLVWGSVVDETVIVQSLGNIQYDDIRPDGTIRGAKVQLSLLVYVPIDVKSVEEQAQLARTNTFYAVTKVGDQWEDMALREYGDPELGDLLRRRNPGLPFPGKVPGSIVLLPKLINLRNEVIEPDSEPLRRTKEGLALRQRLFEARAVARDSAVITR